jgi:hypothetical protein
MNVPVRIDAPRSINELRDFFAGVCESRATLFADDVLTLHEAVDELQAIASLSGLVEAIGQDEVQEIIGGGSPPPAPGLCEALDVEIALRAAETVRGWELSDPRDRWKHTGEHKPKVRSMATKPTPYAPPQSTVDAFLHVAALDDIKRLEAWLDDHRRDAPILLKMLKAKLCK